MCNQKEIKPNQIVLIHPSRENSSRKKNSLTSRKEVGSGKRAERRQLAGYSKENVQQKRRISGRIDFVSS
jgi:hypothetical protein